MKRYYMLNEGGGMRDFQNEGFPPSHTKKEKKEKMKLNLWYGTSLRIIALFVTAMLVSFSPELFRGFFGDSIYPDPNYKYGHGFIDQKWDWGYRHYLYFIMCVFLFIVQACRLVKWIDENKNEFKP
jgi:hypothetical protein